MKYFAWCSLVVTGVSGTNLLRLAVNSKNGNDQEDRRLLFRTSALHRMKLAASVVVSNAASTPNLLYFGGPVISNVDVQPLLWTTSTDSVADSTGIVNFYKVLVNSTHMDWLSEYSTPTQTIGRGIGRDAITLDINSLPQGPYIDDSHDIQPYLKSLYTSGVLNPTANSYYPIHFAPGISVSLSSGETSCSTFCAYHGTVNVGTSQSPTYIYYGVIPDQYSSGCQFGCGEDSNPFNNLCSVSSHELIEAVTDPAVGVATVYGPPLAWYDLNNGEIADICNAQHGVMAESDGVKWTVQKEWSNFNGACLVVKPTPAPTRKPTKSPTPKPTKAPPTRKPTKPAPTRKPTKAPTRKAA